MSTTPALPEILLHLTRAPSRDPAARALLGWLDQTLARLGVRGDRADRVRSRVACKLVEVCRSGRLAEIADPGPYVRRMIQLAVLDLLKEDKRHVGDESFCGEGEAGGRGDRAALPDDSTAEEKAALEASVATCRERARGLLGRAFAQVQQGAAERYHAGLRATFGDLCALGLDAASLPALLARGGGVADTAAVNAAYKRHERMRTSLRDAIAALGREGLFTRREEEQATGCLSLLLRPGQEKRAPGARERRAQAESAAAVLRLEKKQRAPGAGPKSALRGAA